MADKTFIVTKKSGTKKKVTVAEGKRVRIQSTGTGDTVRVIRRGRIVRDPKIARVEDVSQEQKATATVDLKSTPPEQKPADLPPPQSDNVSLAYQNYQIAQQSNIPDSTRKQYERAYLKALKERYPQSNVPFNDTSGLDFGIKQTIPEDLARFETVRKQETSPVQSTIVSDPATEEYYKSLTEPKKILVADVKPPEDYFDFTGRYLEELRQARINEPDASALEKLYAETVVAGGVGAIRGASALIKPIFKPKEAGKEFAEFTKGLATGETQINIGTQFVTNPVGTTAEFYTFGKGLDFATKSAVFVKDVARTKGRTELSRETVTIPEVISGEQRFPFKPQSPKELAKEFEGGSPQVKTVQEIYGKDQPLGFSASPEPLKGGKILTREEIGDFSSASEGLYQAPSLSEHFLKIRKAQEKTSYSFLPQFGGRPTVQIVGSTKIRTFPKSVVKKARASKNPVEYLNEYARKNFKEGESFVTPEFTLGKAESEILGKAGSQFEPVKVAEEFYINIEGRRVPVNAIKLLEENVVAKTTTKTKTKTVEQINKEAQASYESLTKPPSSKSVTSDFLRAGALSPEKYYRDVASGKTDVPLNYSGFKVPRAESIFVPPSESVITQKPSESIIPSGSGRKNLFERKTIYPEETIIKPEDYTFAPRPSRKRGGGSSTPPPPSESIIPPPPSEIIPPPPSRKTPPPSRIRPPPTTTRVPPPVIRPIFGRVKPRKTGGQAFDVLVRKKGVFRKANIQPLTKASAIDFGTYKVGATSSATFKLQKVFGVPQVQRLKGDISNFYRKQELFIEKKEKRIKRKSPQELAEITYKGIATRKAQSKKQNKLFRRIKWV